MKQIAVDAVNKITTVTKVDTTFILLVLLDGSEYVALGDIKKIENTYYCHNGYNIWSTAH